jgi:hypothetical protein
MENQPIVTLNEDDLTILDVVDNVVEVALANQDLIGVMEFGRTLTHRIQANGKAIVYLVYLLHKEWKRFDTDDDFFDLAESELNLRPSTAKRYIRLWEVLFENPNIPKEARQSMFGKPTEALLLLVAAADEGILDWDVVSDAQTVRDIRTHVRDVRGKATKSETALVLTISVREGTIMAKRGNDGMHIVGFLNVKSEDDIVKAAIDRIVERCDVMEV